MTGDLQRLRSLQMVRVFSLAFLVSGPVTVIVMFAKRGPDWGFLALLPGMLLAGFIWHRVNSSIRTFPRSRVDAHPLFRSKLLETLFPIVVPLMFMVLLLTMKSTRGPGLS